MDEYVDLLPNNEIMTEFEPATDNEVREIVSFYGIKCSPEDPVPAPLLTTNIDVFVPIWTEIVNLSLSLGSMECLKSAIIIPLIKDLSSNVDSENMKNYRPVSNLVLISKLVERGVDKRLQKHLTKHGLMIDKQYGYKKAHSTEMLLLNVINNLLKSCDNNIPSIVLLLDLSAAFDTVDHNKLLAILHNEIGIRGTALQWFQSFLTDRSVCIKIDKSYSVESDLLFGVPQGAVLGPPLFRIYIRSLYKYVEPTRLEIEGFADDHQLIKQFLLSMQSKVLTEDIVNCLNYISKWMNDHFLCLNDSKTQILVIAPPAIKNQIVIGGVLLKNSCIRF